jgi:hypothetical protein
MTRIVEAAVPIIAPARDLIAVLNEQIALLERLISLVDPTPHVTVAVDFDAVEAAGIAAYKRAAAGQAQRRPGPAHAAAVVLPFRPRTTRRAAA